jgi:hypothetical protein
VERSGRVGVDRQPDHRGEQRRLLRRRRHAWPATPALHKRRSATISPPSRRRSTNSSPRPRPRAARSSTTVLATVRSRPSPPLWPRCRRASPARDVRARPHRRPRWRVRRRGERGEGIPRCRDRRGPEQHQRRGYRRLERRRGQLGRRRFRGGGWGGTGGGSGGGAPVEAAAAPAAAGGGSLPARLDHPLRIRM